MGRERLKAAELIDQPPYVKRSVEHRALEASGTSSSPLVLYGRFPQAGVTRTLREFSKEIPQVAPHGRPMSVGLMFDFLELDPVAASPRLLAALRNEFVRAADRVRLEVKNSKVPKRPDAKFKYFDAMLEFCWLATVNPTPDDPGPKLLASAATKSRGAWARFILRYGSGGLSDMVMQSEDMVAVVTSLGGEAVSDGIVTITENTFGAIRKKLKKRMLKAKSRQADRYASLFAEAMPDEGPSDPSALQHLLNVFFCDATVELTAAISPTAQMYILLDALDEFGGETAADGQVRRTLYEVMQELTLDQCGVACGSRGKPFRWLDELEEVMIGPVEKTLLTELWKQDVLRAWQAKKAPRPRANEAIRKAFPGRHQRVRPGKLAEAWYAGGGA